MAGTMHVQVPEELHKKFGTTTAPDVGIEAVKLAYFLLLCSPAKLRSFANFNAYQLLAWRTHEFCMCIRWACTMPRAGSASWRWPPASPLIPATCWTRSSTACARWGPPTSPGQYVPVSQSLWGLLLMASLGMPLPGSKMPGLLNDSCWHTHTSVRHFMGGGSFCPDLFFWKMRALRRPIHEVLDVCCRALHMDCSWHYCAICLGRPHWHCGSLCWLHQPLQHRRLHGEGHVRRCRPGGAHAWPIAGIMPFTNDQPGYAWQQQECTACCSTSMLTCRKTAGQAFPVIAEPCPPFTFFLADCGPACHACVTLQRRSWRHPWECLCCCADSVPEVLAPPAQAGGGGNADTGHGAHWRLLDWSFWS